MDGGLVRVMVVDDQRPFRVAAAAVISRMPDFELVGQAETGEDAVEAIGCLCPDLVLMDVRLPGISGIEAAGRVAATTSRSVVVLCSTYARDDLPFPLDTPGSPATCTRRSCAPARCASSGSSSARRRAPAGRPRPPRPRLTWW